MKKIYVLVIFIFSVSINYGQGTSTQIGQTIFGGQEGARIGTRTATSEDGNIIAISAPDNQIPNLRSGFVRVYEFNGTDWIQKGQTLEGTQDLSRFGLSLSISSDGNTLAIAATSYDSPDFQEVGLVKVFEFNGSDWVQKGQEFIGENDNDVFGAGLDLSADGNRLFMGGLDNSGRVEAYEFSGTMWEQLGSTIYGINNFSNFGISLNANYDGTSLVIGAPDSNVNGNSDGAIYVYRLIDDEWVQIGDRITGEFLDDRFGYKVTMNAMGNIIAGSSRFNPGTSGGNAGHIRVFRENGGIWEQLGEDIDGTHPEQLSNMELDQSGLILGVSNPNNDGQGDGRGIMYVLQFLNNEWVQVLSEIEGSNDFDRFSAGFSMNSLATTIAGGVQFDDTNFTNEGRIEIYRIELEGFPEISCSTDISQEINQNSCFATVFYDLPTANDPEDGPLSVLLIEGLPSGSEFPVGVTNIRYQATDSDGNTSSCNFSVIVNENVPPEPTNEILMDVIAQCEVTELSEPGVTDNCSTSITISNDANLPISDQGTTIVTWTYNDGNGNISTQAQNIVIDDDTAPIVSCPEDLILFAESGQDFIILDDYRNPDDSDNCSGVVESNQLPAPGTEVSIGNTIKVNITNSDIIGNSSNCTFTITVQAVLNIEENYLANQIKAYPNSFNEYIIIQRPENLKIIELVLYDIHGKELKTFNMENSPELIKIDTASLNSGAYFLFFQLDEIQTVKKLIKI